MGARAGAIDLVRHQQLGEDRPGDEPEAALAALRFLQYFRAENIRRHQVGRELNAPRIEPEHGAHGFHQLGLGEAGKTDKQRMTAGQDGDQRLLDHRLLTVPMAFLAAWICSAVDSADRTIMSSSFSGTSPLANAITYSSKFPVADAPVTAS